MYKNSLLVLKPLVSLRPISGLNTKTTIITYKFSNINILILRINK